MTLSTLLSSSIVLLFIFLLSPSSPPSSWGAFAVSSRYYDMINAINSGVDYYSVLDLDSTTSPSASDIKKAYHALSRKYHPDKNNTQQAKERYIAIQAAYEVLSDENLKEEYDELNKNGIPWQEQYYGQYVHRYGVPRHDIRYVVLGVIILITIGKYLYQWYRYEVIKGLAKRTTRYKQKRNELRQQQQQEQEQEQEQELEQSGASPSYPSSLSSKNYNNNNKQQQQQQQQQQQESSEEPEIILHGTEMPTFKSLFVVQLMMLPVVVSKWLWDRLFAKKMTPEEQIEEFCKTQGITREEFEKRRQTYQDRMERLKRSSKYKRAMRFMKKNK